MSTTIIAVLVQLLSVGLPLLGITVGTEELTTTASTIAIIVTGIWIWRERVKVGDVSAMGVRK